MSAIQLDDLDRTAAMGVVALAGFAFGSIVTLVLNFVLDFLNAPWIWQVIVVAVVGWSFIMYAAGVVLSTDTTINGRGGSR